MRGLLIVTVVDRSRAPDGQKPGLRGLRKRPGVRVEQAESDPQGLETTLISGGEARQLEVVLIGETLAYYTATERFRSL